MRPLRLKKTPNRFALAVVNHEAAQLVRSYPAKEVTDDAYIVGISQLAQAMGKMGRNPSHLCERHETDGAQLQEGDR